MRQTVAALLPFVIGVVAGIGCRKSGVPFPMAMAIAFGIGLLLDAIEYRWFR